MRSLILTLLLSLVACGASARESTIRTTLIATNAARDGFVAYDAHRQTAIVDAATSLDQGKGALTEYRVKRQPVVEGLSATYRAIAIAAVLEDDPRTLASMLTLAAQVKTLIDTFTGGTP